MEFGIIYTADWNDELADAQGDYRAFWPCASKLVVDAWGSYAEKLAQTENDDDDTISWAFDDDSIWHHAKWVGILDKDEMTEFVRDFALWPDSCETLGSLGVPWTPSGCGWAPAICANRESDDSMLASGQAYVTPLPSVQRPNGWTERDWDRLRRVTIAWMEEV